MQSRRFSFSFIHIIWTFFYKIALSLSITHPPYFIKLCNSSTSPQSLKFVCAFIPNQFYELWHENMQSEQCGSVRLQRPDEAYSRNPHDDAQTIRGLLPRYGGKKLCLPFQLLKTSSICCPCFFFLPYLFHPTLPLRSLTFHYLDITIHIIIRYLVSYLFKLHHIVPSLHSNRTCA